MAWSSFSWSAGSSCYTRSPCWEIYSSLFCEVIAEMKMCVYPVLSCVMCLKCTSETAYVVLYLTVSFIRVILYQASGEYLKRWIAAYWKQSAIEQILMCESVEVYGYTRGADKSLARPGRKQARKHIRDVHDFNNIDTRAFIKIFFFPSRQDAEGNSRHSFRNIILFPF